MNKILVLVLALAALAAGYYGGIAYFAVSSSLSSIRITCALLNSAESTGVIGKEQRAALVDRVIRTLNDAAGATKGEHNPFEQLKTGCVDLPFVSK